ncbi:MAG: hypothetical protein IID45_12825 [Planctomycetes bacterium]|nr:hypothetical protein [Planctomycetota bacterium]
MGETTLSAAFFKQDCGFTAAARAAWSRFRPVAIVMFTALLLETAPVFAQFESNGNGVHAPLNQRTPPGVAGYWAGALGKAGPGMLQPIRIILPTTGQVTVYGSPTSRPIVSPAPANVEVAVGYVYRMKISDMPEFPRVVLYPSVEVIDRLHPPAGKAAQFPIPITITAEEIQFVLNGRYITKVVYLEQPQLASPAESPLPTLTVPATSNTLLEADRRGRPMLIVRIGGRQPSGNRQTAFFGRGGPLRALPSAKAKKN